MYGVLIVFSVPVPLVAGWLSDRVGENRSSSACIVGGAAGFVIFLLAGTSSVLGRHHRDGPVLVRREPPTPAPLADISPPSIRDATYAVYFTLAFGVGSLWIALSGVIIEQVGEAAGVPLVFGIMAVLFVLAALGTVPIHAERRARRECRLRGRPGLSHGNGCAARRGRASGGWGSRRSDRRIFRPVPVRDRWQDRGKPSRATREPARGHLDARILLVEDDPSIREVTAIGLRNAGFTIETAADGREGPRRALADPFDLILLDVCCRDSTASRSVGPSAGPRRCRS